ncbi:MAG TPA: hypothetical protein VLM79_39535, partial [Kofleriaceae bacterium]|nr:hypothetical protein [Kofleriaceae bacterium]
VGLASCALRPPAPLNVEALLAARGPLEARRELQIRVTSDRRDVAARLALADLDERIGRPSEAIDALGAVVALGGPLGVRWQAEDKARLGRLIAARGRTRLARGAATALADLERARGLGATVADGELRAARIAGALEALHHSDAEVRDRGRRTLAIATADDPTASGAAPPATPSAAALPTASGASGRPMAAAAASAMPPSASADAWAGARVGASPERRGRFGAWLWQDGARAAAWEELEAWHAATRPPRDPALQTAYLVAARWWIPLDRPAPPREDLVGPAHCAFTACAPRDVVGDEIAERAYLMGPLAPPVRDPIEATAVAAITLRHALRGDGSWGEALAARVDIAAVTEPAQLAKMPRAAQPIFARLAGRDAPIPGDTAATTADERLLLAAAHALAGSADAVARIDVLLAGSQYADSSYADSLHRIVVVGAPFTSDPVAEAVARHAELSVPLGGWSVATGGTGSTGSEPAGGRAVRAEALRAIVVAYRRDPLIADRIARDAVAEASDAAAMYATLGAVFDALGDPARARAAWQAAVDASAEPLFVRGLAEAQARQGDADAALVTAMNAAAASGDPAVVWTCIARALVGAGKYAHALEAVRSAIDLAGPDAMPSALDVAVAASRALGRNAQADSLVRQRAQLAPGGNALDDGEALDLVAPSSPRAGDSTGTRTTAVSDSTGTRATATAGGDSTGTRAGAMGDGDAMRTRAAAADGNATSARAALAAYRRDAIGAGIERLWVASRWNARHVAIRAALLAALGREDPRRGVVVGELVGLAADREPDVRRAAIAALGRER